MIKSLDLRAATARAVAIRAKDDPFLLLAWRVNLFGDRGSVQRKVIKLALSKSGHRLPEKEHLDFLAALPPVHLSSVNISKWDSIIESVPSALERDLKYRGYLTGNTSYQTELIGILLGN
jgi:hypothetical protein